MTRRRDLRKRRVKRREKSEQEKPSKPVTLRAMREENARLDDGDRK